jgi:hypothetical protein
MGIWLEKMVDGHVTDREGGEAWVLLVIECFKNVCLVAPLIEVIVKSQVLGEERGWDDRSYLVRGGHALLGRDVSIAVLVVLMLMTDVTAAPI